MFEDNAVKNVEPTFSCIVCGGSSNNLLCDSCKEALLVYRNLYFVNKLDEEMFKLAYENAIKHLEDDPITNETDLSFLIEMLEWEIKNDQGKAWYREREGRADRFLEYVRKRARKEFLHAD